MQVIVKGHHIHVSGHLKELATAKVQKLSRFFDRILRIEIEFSHEPSRRAAPAKHRVEVLLTSPLGTLNAHANGADPETAVDAALGKVERQIVKLKDKVASHPKGGIRAKAASPKLASVKALPPEPVKMNGSSPERTSEESPARTGSSSAS
jgi:ribosomal subunit interface protein